MNFFDLEIKVKGIDVLKEEPSKIRGKLVSMVPQEVGAALSPFHKIYDVFEDVIAQGSKVERAKVIEKATETLSFLGFADPERILKSYPHELSGGMLQRVLLALAIVTNPLLIIADEPTSMVDAPLRINIVELLNKIKKDLGITLVVITHDIAITPHLSNKIAVMYAGRIMEYGNTNEVIIEPLHPYTRMLLNSIPRLKSTIDLKLIERRNMKLDPLNACPFADRCESYIEGVCEKIEPKYMKIGNRMVFCHLYE